MKNTMKNTSSWQEDFKMVAKYRGVAIYETGSRSVSEGDIRSDEGTYWGILHIHHNTNIGSGII